MCNNEWRISEKNFMPISITIRGIETYEELVTSHWSLFFRNLISDKEDPNGKTVQSYGLILCVSCTSCYFLFPKS
jgi:hypothetical protein